MNLDHHTAVLPAGFDTPGAVEAIVLAGSHPWTGSAFDELLPRPLLPVAGRAIVDWVVEWLAQGGIARGVVCANGAMEAIGRHFRESDACGVALQFHQDATPRGPAGCVKDAAQRLKARTLIVADGSSVPAFALRDLLECHWRSNAAMTIAAQGFPGSKTSWRPVGVYVLDRSVLDAVPASSFQDIKENLIPKLYAQGQALEVFHVGAVSPRVLNSGSYLALNHWLLERMSERQPAGGFPSHTWIDPTASVSREALVVGPVMIGAGARVEAHAVIVGPTSIGAGTVVESGAVVSRSVTWAHCRIGRDAVVDQAVLASGATADHGDGLLREVRLKQPRPAFDWTRLVEGAARVRRMAGWAARTPNPTGRAV